MAACAMVALLGTPAIAVGGCLDTTNSEFTVLIDASSSCAALGGGITGCQVDSTGSCTIPNPTPGGDPIVVQVTPSTAVGEIPSEPNLVSWSATGPASLGNNLVDFVILLGATGGGTCGWSYTPGASIDSGLAFQKSNGSYQKVNDIFVCSDFTAPPPALAVLVLGKTVMPAGGTCGVDDVEVLDVNQNDNVEYCFSIQNVGAGAAGSVTLSDPDVYTVDLDLGNIAAGAPATTVKSPTVTAAATGEIINTATVSWVNADDPGLSSGSATDTAKLLSTVALETCPAEYQQLVDGVIAGNEDFYGFAALFDPFAPERLSLCAPTASATGADGIRCQNSCTLKPECELDPLDPDCLPPNHQCEQSGNWSVGTDQFNCTDNSGSNDLPFCWEPLADRDRNCEYAPVQPMDQDVLIIQRSHQNPFCFTVYADGDQNGIGVLHCF